MTSLTIVGGGVAGLALAAALDPSRWDVTLIEQRPGVPEVGTAFGIWPVAVRALTYLGLGDWFAREAVHVSGGSIRDASDRVIVGMERVEMRLVARPTLLTALDRAVPGSVRRESRRVTDPAELVADLVVAADGARSRIRTAVWGSAARPVGTWAIRGTLPGTPPSAAMGEYWGDRVLFGISPNTGGTTNWYATLHRDPGSSADALTALRETHRDFPPAVQRVLAAAAPERTLVNEILVSPSTSRLVRGRHVLIGDAAHAMTPNLGRGACEALVDAVCLGHELNRRGLAEGVRAYQRQRLLPGQAVRAAASVALRIQEGGPAVHRIVGLLGPGARHS